MIKEDQWVLESFVPASEALIVTIDPAAIKSFATSYSGVEMWVVRGPIFEVGLVPRGRECYWFRYAGRKGCGYAVVNPNATREMCGRDNTVMKREENWHIKLSEVKDMDLPVLSGLGQARLSEENMKKLEELHKISCAFYSTTYWFRILENAWTNGMIFSSDINELSEIDADFLFKIYAEALENSIRGSLFDYGYERPVGKSAAAALLPFERTKLIDISERFSSIQTLKYETVKNGYPKEGTFLSGLTDKYPVVQFFSGQQTYKIIGRWRVDDQEETVVVSELPLDFLRQFNNCKIWTTGYAYEKKVDGFKVFKILEVLMEEDARKRLSIIEAWKNLSIEMEKIKQSICTELSVRLDLKPREKTIPKKYEQCILSAGEVREKISSMEYKKLVIGPQKNYIDTKKFVEELVKNAKEGTTGTTPIIGVAAASDDCRFVITVLNHNGNDVGIRCANIEAIKVLRESIGHQIMFLAKSYNHKSASFLSFVPESKIILAAHKEQQEWMTKMLEGEREIISRQRMSLSERLNIIEVDIDADEAGRLRRAIDAYEDKNDAQGNRKAEGKVQVS